MTNTLEKSEGGVQAREDDVLRRMLNTHPKPHDKPKESSQPRRRGRPISSHGKGSNHAG